MHVKETIYGKRDFLKKSLTSQIGELSNAYTPFFNFIQSQQHGILKNIFCGLSNNISLSVIFLFSV